MRNWTMLWVVGVALACTEEHQNSVTPYALGQALRIGPDKGGTPAPLNEICDADPDQDSCEAQIERCGDDAYADVVLDEDQSALDVICYPGRVSVREVGADPVPSASAGNHSVLVLDDLDDGADVTGDVTLSGNGSILYGHGARVSVVGGSVVIEKNNAIVRGVHIEGDVTITKNNAQLAFCEIGGALTVLGNNATVAECVVHGRARIEGNNAVFVRNELAQDSELSGKNLKCNANVVFDPDAGAPDAGAAPAPTPVSCDDGH
ncbi:MAG TPA: hypothetical protein VFS67_01425 [Polyangiaceae bacterium]|nr:hypothetical protein [Polyangiaceae bacterium]